MKYAKLDRYTDKNGVLINKLNAKTDDELEAKERRLVAMNSIGLRLSPVQGNFDLAHLQAIHWRLFNEIFSWAGELREVGITKGQTVFAAPYRIVPEFEKLHNRISNEDFSIKDKETVAKTLAFYLGEINILHPFREGNGRTQREFIIQLAHQFGFYLHFNEVTQQQMVEASEASALYANNSFFEQIIFERLTTL